MFIKLNDRRIVNPNQVISLKFTPLYPAGVDEETKENYNAIPAQLDITTTALRIEVDTNFDGDVRGGAASESETIIIRGEDAERAWKEFNNLP